ncbi:MAG: outer membrane protein assembly factor [Bacteroidetes bacterium]|nr:outer membrane protein assembly factor [Bacteroidota bacterium]
MRCRIFKNLLIVKVLTGVLLSEVCLQTAYSQRKQWNLLPFPVVYYTPETRWAYGGAITSTFRFRTDSLKARPSQLSLGIVFTQEKQSLYYLPFQLFPQNGKYYFYGELGFYRYNYYFFGIGKDAIPKELYGVDFPRIRLNAFKKVSANTYLGVRYQYEDYRITETEPNGVFAQGKVVGSPRSQTSGVGLGLFYDSRDILFYPTKGAFVDAAYWFHSPIFGGNVTFQRLTADAALFKKIGAKIVVAANLYGSLNWGNPPFNMLSEMGGSKRMRGYYQGRFRDNNVLLTQAEIRIDLIGRLKAVGFTALGLMGASKPVLRFADPKMAHGVGLRFVANRKDALNLRVDYAVGSDGGNYYFTIGEAF